MRVKKLVKTTNTILEATAIKNAINNLNKKLGDRKRATIKRNRNMRFEIYV